MVSVQNVVLRVFVSKNGRRMGNRVELGLYNLYGEDNTSFFPSLLNDCFLTC